MRVRPGPQTSTETSAHRFAVEAGGTRIRTLAPGVVRLHVRDQDVVAKSFDGLPAATADFVAATQNTAAGRGLAPRAWWWRPQDPGPHPGRLVLVSDLVEGPEFPPFPDMVLAALAGAALGRLHDALRTCRPLADEPRMAACAPGEREVQRLHDALERHRRTGCPHGVVTSILRHKLALTEGYATVPPPREPDPIPLHGDVHSPNIVLSDGSPVFVDFARARWGAPGYELVRALLYLLRPADPVAGAPMVGAFIRGYLGACADGAPWTAGAVHAFTIRQAYDPHGVEQCHDAPDALIAFGVARWSLLRWLLRSGAALQALIDELAGTAVCMSPPDDGLDRPGIGRAVGC